MISFLDLPEDFNDVELQAWLQVCATSLGVRIKRLVYHVVDDKRILQVNKNFLDHDYFTDIITFDYGTKTRLVGDVYVSKDMVLSNAKKLGVEYKQEFLRVLAHGMLHLTGLKDQNIEEQGFMREKEEFCLSLHPENL